MPGPNSPADLALYGLSRLDKGIVSDTMPYRDADPVHAGFPQTPDRTEVRPSRFRHDPRHHLHRHQTDEATLSWIGPDGRGRELEIVALERPDCFLVFHVMPTHYCKAGP